MIVRKSNKINNLNFLLEEDFQYNLTIMKITIEK